jgi:hypothetical protein
MLPPGHGTPPQRARLEKLAQWSVDHNEHAYFMSWVWLGTGGVYVDIFLPEDSPATAGLKTEWINVPGSTHPWEFRVSRPDSRPESAPAADTAVSRAAVAVEKAMKRSFEQEDTLGTLSGVEVRGRWIRGNAIGPAHHEVLLGVLGERVPVDHRGQRRRRASQTDRLDVFLEGRLLTLVSPVDGPRPSWGRIRSELLE